MSEGINRVTLLGNLCADPELRQCLESLAAQIAASSGSPTLSDESVDPIPVINRS